MGTGMTNQGQCYTKRASIRNYVFNKLKLLDEKKWEQNIKKYKNLDYSQKFYENDQNVLIATDEEIEKILKQLGKQQKGDHLNCGACGYDTCVEHALAISKGLAETEMCLPFTIEKLHRYVKELAVSNQNLASMKQALHQSEKLAHMGQLSAGIAHELNNPLGVIIMYSNILLEECKDSQMKEDLDLIVEQTARCKKIVGGLLNFARNNQVRYESIKMKKLLEDCLHSIVIPSNVTITKQFCFDDLDVMLDKEQMIQAISNLIKNSIDAMPNGGDIKIIASTESENVFISIADNGVGISKENIDKIFTPFFTTKQAGKGTGLGLPTTYGIIKMHRGDITMETNDDPSIGQTGTTFNIKIPKNNLMQ
ncbi:MAG: GHKL domain-containing protein [Bacteroidetes bacterium]|nr:GHKL domain-containing protein [Bacteroidota bacterium]